MIHSAAPGGAPPRRIGEPVRKVQKTFLPCRASKEALRQGVLVIFICCQSYLNISDTSSQCVGLPSLSWSEYYL